MFTNYTFENIEYLWFFCLVPIAVVWFVFFNKKTRPTLKVSTVKGFEKIKKSGLRLKTLLFSLRVLTLSFLILAISRPQTRDSNVINKKNHGIDIIMAIDVSSSMLALDLKPNRLKALKKVAHNFIKQRINDRIGIVVYAGESYTKTPITSDKSVSLSALAEIKNGKIEDGTAIGVGLATAVNRLKESKSKSKVIILLTDGVNTAGFINPLMATEFAMEFNIKIYTIGIGTNGMAKVPVSKNVNGTFFYDYRQVEIDEDLLKTIAKRTNGKYFRATNNEKLKSIYDEIDKLEKTIVEEIKYYHVEEKFRSFAIIASILLLLEVLLRNTILKSFI